MSVPKIGREQSEKSEVLRIADDLAAKSRILRRAAAEQDAVLDRLRRIGDDVVSEAVQREKAAVNVQVDEIRPLIDKARQYIDDAAAARSEARPALAAIDSVNWDAVSASVSFEHGMTQQKDVEAADSEGETILRASPERFSTMNTRQRIGLLRRAVEDLRPLVDMNSDSELRARLRDAEDVMERPYPGGEVRSPSPSRPDAKWLQDVASAPNPEWKQSWDMKFRYAVNSLRQSLSYGSLAEAIRGRVDGIKRLLSEIGTDVLTIGEEAK